MTINDSITGPTNTGKKWLSSKRKGMSSTMRVTDDIVVRANARTMARTGRLKLSLPSRTLTSDGSIEVSVRYGGRQYLQHITPQQLNQSFGKAFSSHVKKI